MKDEGVWYFTLFLHLSIVKLSRAIILFYSILDFFSSFFLKRGRHFSFFVILSFHSVDGSQESTLKDLIVSPELRKSWVQTLGLPSEIGCSAPLFNPML
jgi:hypothetical protein